MAYKKWKKMFDSIWERERNTFIQFLLDAGLDVNTLNKYGKTMLSYAAECGNLEITEFLIKEGANGNVTNSNDGSKPLHIAAKLGHKDIVKFFLNTGVFVDSCDNQNCTPLHYVAAKKNIPEDARESYQELVHFLVNSNSDLNAVNRHGCTPLLLAAQNSRKHIVELLMKYGANVECCDKNQWSVLHHSSASGWSGIVRSLVEGRFDIDLDATTSVGNTPLIIAADSSHRDVVKLLIESGANVKCQGFMDKTVLHYACEKGWQDIVESLVKKRCDLNAKDSGGNTPLLLAFKYSHSNVVVCLIESGADVECFTGDEWKMLHTACEKGWLDVVKSLVNRRFDLNAKDCRGNTLLLVAAEYSHSDVVKYLIESGADFNCCNEDGSTLLHIACKNGLLDIVKTLINKGCGLNAKDSRGNTSLLLACKYSHSNVVVCLIESGADVECSTGDEWKMLHSACKKGWLDVVKALVNRECDLNAKDSGGNTPLLLAFQYSHSNVVVCLVESGADVEYSMGGEWKVLHSACKKGWLDVVKSLVNRGCDLNVKDSEGNTPLLLSFKYSHSNVVLCLIESGANVEWKVLRSACKKGWLDVVKSLVNRGFDLIAKDSRGNILLLVAAEYSHSEVVKYLIESGVDFNCCNEAGSTFLHLACKNGLLHVVKLLINKGCDLNAKNFHGFTPLLMAAEYSHFEVVEYLIESFKSCNKNLSLLLHSACEKGMRNVVESLVKKGCDVNAKDSRGFTPLLLAVKYSHSKVAEFLIESGAKVEFLIKSLAEVELFSESLVEVELFSEPLPEVELFSEYGTSNDTCCHKDEWTLLHYACYKGCLDVVILLVKKGCDLNPKDTRGSTPLLVAADSLNFEIVKYLIEYGADFKCCNKNGSTLLHSACKNGWLNVVEFLIKKGCDFNAKCNDTPLLLAAHHYHSKVVECLIESGADVKVYDLRGWTVLHYACEKGWLNVAKSFIKKGYDLNARDSYHDTPLHFAVESRNLEIIKHLLKAGADCNIENVSGKTAFNGLIQNPLCLEVIVLFIENGACFQSDDVSMLEKPLLQETILQNMELCTQAVINKFNNADLPKLYEIPVVAERLPPIEKLKIARYGNVARDISHSVMYEIQTKGHCNVLNLHLFALNILSVGSLVRHYQS